jgi:hypothetical protein
MTMYFDAGGPTAGRAPGTGSTAQRQVGAAAAQTKAVEAANPKGPSSLPQRSGAGGAEEDEEEEE